MALDEVLSTAPPRVLDLSVQPRGPDLQLGRSCVAVVVLSRTRDTRRINPLGAENGNEQLFQIESRRYGRNATIGPGRFWKQYLHSVLHGGAGDVALTRRCRRQPGRAQWTPELEKALSYAQKLTTRR